MHQAPGEWRAAVTLQKSHDEGGGKGTVEFGSQITEKSKVCDSTSVAYVHMC